MFPSSSPSSNNCWGTAAAVLIVADDARRPCERGSIVTRAPPSMVRAVRRIVMVVVVADPTRRDDADVADARMDRMDTFPVARIVVVVVIIVDRSVVRPRRCLRFIHSGPSKLKQIRQNATPTNDPLNHVRRDARDDRHLTVRWRTDDASTPTHARRANDEGDAKR